MLSDEELLGIERELRNILGNLGFGWVVSELAQITAVLEEIDEPDERFSGKRAPRQVRFAARQRTPRERVVEYVNALRRLVVDLPDVEAATLTALRGTSERVPGRAVEQIVFLPADTAEQFRDEKFGAMPEPAVARVSRTTKITDRDREARAAVDRLRVLLDALAEEVDS